MEAKPIYTRMTRCASVRRGFAEVDVWGDALQRNGVNVPVRVAVIDGPMDAPEIMPAGGMYSNSKRGPCGQYTLR